MLWKKKGLIFNAKGQFPWMMHHACVPVADWIDEDRLRIYFGPRDARGKSHIGYIEVGADNPSNILYVHDRPVLSPGKLGTFDDSGVMPSSIVERDGRKYLFYIGWNEGVTVSYRNSVGIAVSDDGGRSFTRLFEGPVVDRTRDEPYFCASPFAMFDEDDDLWKLWYASSTGWTMVDGHTEPLYRILYAESDNGVDWRRRQQVCIPYGFDGEANARPTVWKENGRFRMVYCFRGSVGYRHNPATSYRLGYAESCDGITWKRMDDQVGIERSVSGWDAQMMEYPFVYKHRGRTYMLYNGNGFGETGFGYAELVEG